MIERVDADQIERIVGIRRHETWHYGRAVSSEQKVYVLHSSECLNSGIDLYECPYSVALESGIDPEDWPEDIPLPITIHNGFLVPTPVVIYND